MEIFGSIYPSLADRKPLPAYYTPAVFLLSILPFLTRDQHLASRLTFPILLILCATWPLFTSGDPSSDYYNNSHFIALPLWYLDFVICTPRDELAYIGSHDHIQSSAKRKGHVASQSQRWKDLTTTSQRLQWAIRLMLPAQRGIGWNWQVKGVPSNPDAALMKWDFVRKQVCWAVFYYLQSMAALIALGLGVSLREDLQPESQVVKFAAGAVIGWSGAIWVWDRLCCAYSLAAVIAVAVGLTEAWEWPPLMGNLKDACSVRQMWSSTYHQNCRRLLSQPSIRIARFFGILKGSPASGYSQLFISFGISCLFHQAQMFNVTRRDMGEFAFFMSQPLAIVAEDLVQWIWTRSNLYTREGRLERLVGYAWTFAWFSYSLQFYVSGLVEAQVMKDWFFAYEPLSMGVTLGQQLMGGLST